MRYSSEKMGRSCGAQLAERRFWAALGHSTRPGRWRRQVAGLIFRAYGVPPRTSTTSHPPPTSRSPRERPTVVCTRHCSPRSRALTTADHLLSLNVDAPGAAPRCDARLGTGDPDGTYHRISAPARRLAATSAPPRGFRGTVLGATSCFHAGAGKGKAPRACPIGAAAHAPVRRRPIRRAMVASGSGTWRISTRACGRRTACSGRRPLVVLEFTTPRLRRARALSPLTSATSSRDRPRGVET